MGWDTRLGLWGHGGGAKTPQGGPNGGGGVDFRRLRSQSAPRAGMRDEWRRVGDEGEGTLRVRMLLEEQRKRWLSRPTPMIAGDGGDQWLDPPPPPLSRSEG